MIRDGVSIITSKSNRLELEDIESGRNPISSEHYFTFDYESMEVENIHYDIKASRRFNERPHVLVDTYLSNNTGDGARGRASTSPECDASG